MNGPRLPIDVLHSSLDHWSGIRSKWPPIEFEFPSKTDRIEFPAEVAQLVEQWSEESRAMRLQELLGNSRLIPIFSVEEQWSQRSIVLKCGGQAVFLATT